MHFPATEATGESGPKVRILLSAFEPCWQRGIALVPKTKVCRKAGEDRYLHTALYTLLPWRNVYACGLSPHAERIESASLSGSTYTSALIAEIEQADG